MPEFGGWVVNRPCPRRYAAAACSRRLGSYPLAPPATSAHVVIDRRARGGQGGLADPEVVTAQQQVHRVRPAGRRRHDDGDNRPGRAATARSATTRRRLGSRSSSLPGSAVSRSAKSSCANQPFTTSGSRCDSAAGRAAGPGVSVPKDLPSYQDRPSRTALLNDRAARTARALQAARWMPLRCWSDKLTYRRPRCSRCQAAAGTSSPQEPRGCFEHPDTPGPSAPAGPGGR
jgi:hypothetical protein